MSPKKRRSRRVREPIQVYLDARERAALDRLARELGVSRAEVLRRGLEAIGAGTRSSAYDPIDDLIGAFDNPDAPTDLAENFHKYQAEDLEREWHSGHGPSS